MRLALILLAFTLASSALAQEVKPARPADGDVTELATLKARNKLLKQEADRYKAEVALLQRKVRELEAKLDAVQKPADAAETARPGPTDARREEATEDPKASEEVVPAAAAAAPDDEVQRVIFVLDAGRSMSSKYEAATAHLAKAVGELPAGTQFNVLLAGEEAKPVAFSPKPVPATAEARAAVEAFFSNNHAGGVGPVLPAVQMAIERGADLIWLVTDGDVGRPDVFRAEVKKANSRGRSRINTVLFHGDPDRRQWARRAEFMLAIAEENGGRCFDGAGELTAETIAAEAARKGDRGRPPAGTPGKSRSGRGSAG